MSKIYDIAFRMGVLFNILLFTMLNVISFTVNQSEYEKSEIKFAPAGFSWGFPFNWGKNYSVFIEGSSILNIIAAVFGCLMFGFLFKFIWSKISSNRAELK